VTRARSVRWHEAAVDDLVQIVDHIAKFAPRAAHRLQQRIFKKTELIGTVPHLGAVCPFYRCARYVVVSSYVVYYQVHRTEIVIRAVIHGAQRFRRRWLDR